MSFQKFLLRPVRAARSPFCSGAASPRRGKGGLAIAGCLMAIVLTALSVSSPAAVPAATSGTIVPVQADACLPLLEVADQGPEHSPYHPQPSAALPLPDGEEGRDARAALTLSLIFGIRHATGPKESGTRPKPVQTADDSAVKVAAVTAYRRCMSQQRLDAMNAAAAREG